MYSPEVNDNDYLCSLLEKVAHEGMAVLELGVEYGVSTLAMAEFLKGYNGHLVVIDHWLDEEMYCTFLARLSGQDYRISPYRCNLFKADRFFLDRTFDLIHFDACYTYPEVKRMIQRYLPKLKAGGIACGHGADLYWGDLSFELQQALDIYPDCITATVEVSDELADCIKLKIKPGQKRYGIHTNLAKALYEVFNDDYLIDRKHTYWSKVVN